MVKPTTAASTQKTIRVPSAAVNAALNKKCECRECPHLSSTLFAFLPPAQLANLKRVKVCNTYLPGQVIFYQGNYPVGVYCVEAYFN